MPYIALQLVGIQAVLEVAGIGGGDNWFVKDLPLFIAFAVLAAFTYSSGLRAPAVIAFVKDTLIYLVIIVAIIYLPGQVGGWDAIFGAAEDKMASTNEATGAPDRRVHPGRRPGLGLRHARARLGAGAVHVPALDHREPVLGQPQHDPAQRGASCRRTPSCWGCSPCSAGWRSRPAPSVDGRRANPQLVIPQLFEDFFPDWFAGVAFAAIAIGALVPAAIMSIAAANTFTRNIYKECLKKDATPAQEAKVSKVISLLVKAVALVFVLTLDNQNAINFQLLGGIWILQTFPAIVFSLYTRWFHRWALLAGWAVGMVYGTIAAYRVINPLTGKHFGGSLGGDPRPRRHGLHRDDRVRAQPPGRRRAHAGAQRGRRSPTAPTPPSLATTTRTPTTRGSQADLASEDDLTRGEPRAT